MIVQVRVIDKVLYLSCAAHHGYSGCVCCEVILGKATIVPGQCFGRDRKMHVIFSWSLVNWLTYRKIILPDSLVVQGTNRILLYNCYGVQGALEMPLAWLLLSRVACDEVFVSGFQ